MKHIVSILFALLILLQSFSKVCILISFKLNQDYIARVLCINRDKPELTCNGKCFLKDQLKKDEEPDKNQLPQKLKEHREAVYYVELYPWFSTEITSSTASQQIPVFYQSLHTLNVVQDIFHPPDAVLTTA